MTPPSKADAQKTGRRNYANRDLLIVVLAAGRGTRMRSQTPKVMHTLAGEPLLAYPVTLARSLGSPNIVVVHSPGQEELIESICNSCRQVPQARPRGTGDAVNQVPQELHTAPEVLVLYGDVPLLTLPTVKALIRARRNRDADVAILAAHVSDPSGYGRVVVNNGSARIVEEADATPDEVAGNLVNTGVSVFSGEALWPALAAVKKSSRTGEYYLTEVFARLPKRAVVECPEEEALGVNNRWQLAAASHIIRGRISRSLADSGVTIVDPATTYIDAGVRIEPDVVVEPFSFLRGQTTIGEGSHIGPFAEITDCLIGRECVIGRSHLVSSTIEDQVIIGPFNRLRAGTVVARNSRIGSFAEIKNTLVGPGSDVHHFSYLGDAVLGKGVNIGAGTVTANYDGVSKRQTVIGNGVFIGSDSTLVAPVQVGDGAYTAAGSVVTKDVEAGSLAVARSDQTEIKGWAKRRRTAATTASRDT